MTRIILVEGRETFRVTVPDDARLTFGPFSPPSGEERGYSKMEKAVGTLRVYKGGTTKANEQVLAVFTGVSSFRDLSEIDVAVKVVTEEVSSIWKSDAKGYTSERTGKIGTEWVEDAALLGTGKDDEKDGDF